MLTYGQAERNSSHQMTEVVMSQLNTEIGDYLVTAGTVSNLKPVC